MEYTIEEKNNAITAYMGGPRFIKENFMRGLMEEEFSLMGPEDLKFHLSWDWIMPVWKKLRLDLMSTADQASLLFALSKALDDVNLEAFHKLVSLHCTHWCERKQIKIK